MSTPANTLYEKARTSKCKKPKPCGCPTCRGLQCLERPRFFAGQLLTEEELNGEQAYQIAKNRLQNRYLHGPGVVCGLEVTCSDCEGQVHVGTGYAIDPCGNDIIVCEETTFDLLDAIAQCCERSHRKRDACDPYQPPPAKGCEDLEQTWCIAVEYQEKEARPVTPLKPGKKSCGCGGGSSCGCGGSSSNGNGCGCGKPPGQCSCASKNGGTQTSAPMAGSCEPTRIRETYCLSVMEEPEWCKNLLRVRTPTRTSSPLVNLLRLIPENSLLGNIIACWLCAFEILSATVKNDDWAILFLAAEQKFPSQTTPAQLHAALCRLRQAVVDLFAANPHNTRCQMIKVLDSIDCPRPSQGDAAAVGNAAAYQAQVAPIIRNLLTMIAQYLIDCICEAFVPPCSPDPLDNRVILACVTVKDGKILRICQFGCRSYAGSFPSLYYWLSGIPVASLIKMGLEWLCCSADLVRANSPLVNDLYKFLDKLDPGAEKRSALVANDFAGARKLMDTAEVGFDRATFKKFRDAIAKGFEGASGLSDFVGKKPGDIRKALEDQKVGIHFRKVASETEMDAPSAARMSVAREGDQILAYIKDDKVLGFASYTTEERLRDKEAEIDKTLVEMKALRDELGKYRRG